MEEKINSADNIEENTVQDIEAAGESKNKKKKKKKKQSFSEKLFSLWDDKRKFKGRLITSIIAAFAFVYTFFVFGPIEIYLSNMTFFAFSAKHLFPAILVSAAIIFAVLTAILSLLKGKIYNYAVSLVFSVSVMGYLQGNFINIDHGSLDGHDVIWQEFKTPAMLNILLWGLAIIIPLAIQFFNRKIWKYMVRIVSIILVGAQTAAFVSIFVTTYYSTSFTDVSDGGYLTREGIYEVSSEKNVIVFLLDRFDKKYAEEQFEKDEKIAEQLKGFTFYENFTGSYTRTCPSVTYFLTGVKCDYTIPMSEYFKKAWSGQNMMSDIMNAGYESRLYTEVVYTMQNSEYAREEAQNIGGATHSADPMKILSAMYGLSMYRYAPEFFKPYYHIYTGDISTGYIFGEDDKEGVYATDDVKFYKDLVKKGLKTDKKSKGTFLFYHLQGSHDPFVMNEFGEKATFTKYAEGRYQQTKGNLNMIFKYIELLKENGVYDNTTIIITADHARTGTYKELASDPEYGERVLSLFIKPAGADAEKPLERSKKQICQDNLRASIVSYFGLDTEKYGRTIEEIGEDEEIPRYFWMNACGTGLNAKRRDIYLITYKIVGDANDFANWEKVSTEPIKYPYYDA